MTPLLERRFVVVAGKGGVGRTTVSLALGAAAARREKRALVCLPNAPPRYAGILEGETLGPGPREISPGLFAANLDPVASREEYGLSVLRSRALHRLLFGSRLVGGFLDAVPGLSEWAILGKATHWALSRDEPEGGWDLVVFDAPATGHGLDVLALPRTIAASIPPGRMRDEALRRVALMEDSDRCEVVPVTLPEDLAVNETVETIERLGALRMSVRRIVVNMVEEVACGPEVEDLVDRAYRDGDLPSWLMPAAAALGRARTRDESLSRLSRAAGLPLVELPLLGGGRLDRRAFEDLVDRLDASGAVTAA